MIGLSVSRVRLVGSSLSIISVLSKINLLWGNGHSIVIKYVSEVKRPCNLAQGLLLTINDVYNTGRPSKKVGIT